MVTVLLSIAIIMLSISSIIHTIQIKEINRWHANND